MTPEVTELINGLIDVKMKPLMEEVQDLRKRETDLMKRNQQLKKIIEEQAATIKLYEKARIAGTARSFEQKAVQVNLIGVPEPPADALMPDDIQAINIKSEDETKRIKLAVAEVNGHRSMSSPVYSTGFTSSPTLAIAGPSSSNDLVPVGMNNHEQQDPSVSSLAYGLNRLSAGTWSLISNMTKGDGSQN